jgi:ATP-dependent Clp protease ATP-binding subunit ClpA
MNDKERFDKFTERARQVLSLAQEEAQRFNHNYIGTEHLLLGLVREGDSTAAKVLSNLGVELNKVRGAVEFIIGRGDRIVLGEIGLTPRSKKVIELAVDEARRLNHRYIGTEHLLLGLVREGEGVAAGVLGSLGVTLEKARAQTLKVLVQDGGGSRAASPTAEARDQDRYDGFTEGARKAMSLAHEEANRLRHNYIGTEHLLLGLIHQGDGVAANVLRSVGIELENARRAVESIIGVGDRVVLGDVGLTPRSKKVIELAADEARLLNHHDIGTEHLLLGIVREGEGIACGVLESLGVTLEKVRTETLQVLNQESKSARAQPSTPGLTPDTWGTPALSVERLTHIQEEMQQTFRLGDRDPEESLDAAQGRAYSLARSIGELLTEISRLQEELRRRQ